MRRYALSFVSGITLALVFFPFYWWPLAFVALAPFFYFVADKRRSWREVFVGGFLVGLLGIGPLIYLSLAQLTLFPDATAFTFLIRSSSIPVALLVGSLFGCTAVLCRVLRSPSPAFNTLVGASVYLLVIEAPLFWLFDGYYYGALSHAAVSFKGALFAATLGGGALVSFLLAWGNVVLAEALGAYQKRDKRFFILPGVAVLLWGGLCVGYALPQVLVKGPNPAITAAIIQGEFEDYTSIAGDTVIVYPFSLSEGITTSSDDRAIGERLANSFPASTTVVLWQTIAQGEKYFDELAVWKDGEKSSYKKRILYALSDDYTPAWLTALGIKKSLYVITSAIGENTARINEEEVGSLICSEIHQQELARQTAASTQFIVAVGSDSMFPGSLSGNFSLAAARLRAAENGIPVIRANVQGPSAVVDADGSLQAVLNYGERGILRGSVPLTPHATTLFAHLGGNPLYVLTVLSVALAGALAMRRKETTAPDRSARD